MSSVPSSSLSPQPFSYDLVAESKKHVAFLRQLHRLGVTLQPVTAEMVQRYAVQWLPLVAAVSSHQVKVQEDAKKQQLVPPPDIAWLWHCHRLAPARYQAYCEARFGRILEPDPPFCFQVEDEQAGIVVLPTSDSDISNSLATQQTWTRVFSGEPFFYVSPTENEEKVNKKEECAPSEPSSLPSCLACDKNKSLLLDDFHIGASSQCQANFLWQVSGPRFAEDSFLEDGVINYFKFLQLSSQGSNLPLVPTYQIDLMWHTHMLIHTENYNQDCIRIRGGTFHHDDSLNDRTKGAKLDRAFQETVRLWKQAYPGRDYVVAGGMYRGEPADIYFETDLWTPELGHDAGDRFGNNVIVAGSSSSGTTSDDYCWEFLDDAGWQAYSDVHQRDIEQAFQNLQAACKVEIKSGNWTYKVNVVTMKQTNVEHPGRKTRAVRRQVNAATAPTTIAAATGESVAWEYEGDKGWECYSSAAMTALENSYLLCHSLRKVQIKTKMWAYEVDVADMTQTNVQHVDWKTRKVRRKYVPPGTAAASASSFTTSYSAAKASIPLPGSPRQWRDPVILRADPSIFIPAAPRSHQRYVNNNQPKVGYVFGRGSAGDGYYSLETRDAYHILHLRLRRREAHAKSKVDNYDCNHCICCGICKPTSAQIREKEELIQKYHEMSAMAAFSQAKYMTASPDTVPDANDVKLLMQRAAPTRDTYDYHSGGGVIFPYVYTDALVCTAGGCGGGDGGCGAGWYEKATSICTSLDKLKTFSNLRFFSLCCFALKQWRRSVRRRRVRRRRVVRKQHSLVHAILSFAENSYLCRLSLSLSVILRFETVVEVVVVAVDDFVLQLFSLHSLINTALRQTVTMT